MDETIARHRAACEGFSAIVGQADGSWESRSPCSEWDARGVMEHVIGFHDVLLLRPTGTKPSRPKDDPVGRWAVTVPAIDSAVERISAESGAADADRPPVDLGRLLPMLTTDVLVHTWDLARAVGVDHRLDPELCEISYELARSNEERLRAQGMFGPAVPVTEDADAPTRLIAFLGRDPEWTPSTDPPPR